MSEGDRQPVVWIVDDSPTERAISERSLGAGFRFVHFTDGAEVVERIASGVTLPDVVLLDWVMPGMTGDEVCRFLRAREATRDLPVILVTATRIETHDVVHGLAAGANDYVARPFAAEELRARVEAILRVKQLADAARRERKRLDTINRLGKALFSAGTEVRRIVEELATAMTASLCDGCAIMLLPGVFPELSVARHKADPSGAALAAISSLADPTVHAFADDDQAIRTLPPTYHGFIRAHGLRGLGILPFPTLAPIQGVVTVTREGGSEPFAAEDIDAITTCIEYTSLAVQNALRFEAERLSRAQLDALFAHAPFGIVITDDDGTVRMTNPTAARLLPGVERASVLPDIFALARWHGPGGAALDEATWHTRWWQPDGGPAQDVGLDLGAGPRVLSVWTTALGDGAVSFGRVTTFGDVSAARQMTAERERVAAFQEQMIGIVSHDLRSPLSAITTGLSVLELDGEDVPRIVPIIRRMRSSASRMTAMIDQLLDVTRARLGGGIPVRPKPTSLGQLARNVVDEVALARSTSRVELVIAGDVDGTWDPDRLGQVISNLVGNALQYGHAERAVRVEVRGEGDTVTLAVTNAIGDAPIPPEKLRDIFDPFARGKDSSRNLRGLGLGLYIVAEIVRSHRGTIRAESTADGTVFTVVLPRDGRAA